MSKIDIERLKVDVDYWDEVAKEWATHFCTIDNEFWKCTTSIPCDQCIPRPTKQEWDGAGLPPVGVECEVRHLGFYNNNWLPFRVTAVTNDFIVGYINNDRESAFNHKDPYVGFRPLKSKQERQRDELVDLISHHQIYTVAVSNLADDILSRYNLEEK